MTARHGSVPTRPRGPAYSAFVPGYGLVELVIVIALTTAVLGLVFCALRRSERPGASPAAAAAPNRVVPHERGPGTTPWPAPDDSARSAARNRTI